MRQGRVAILLGTGVLVFSLLCGPWLSTPAANAAKVSSDPTDPASGKGSSLLTATNTGPRYAPTFTGNGELGVRVPPEGQGYSGGSVPTQSELAGFYAQPPGGVQERANIPTWSTLGYSDEGQTFTLSNGHTNDWRQSINLRTGVVTTSTQWVAPNGHVTDLSYRVFTDRARPDLGLVRLELTPRWTGPARVTDLIDGSAATMSTQVGKGWSLANRRDWVTVRTEGTNITAAVASQLTTSGNVRGTTVEVDQAIDQSVGQQLVFSVVAGHRYTFTKYVSVETSQVGGDPIGTAETQAGDAATIGLNSLLSGNDAAWAALWSGRIDVSGNPTLATEVNASEFYLFGPAPATGSTGASPRACPRTGTTATSSGTPKRGCTQRSSPSIPTWLQG